MTTITYQGERLFERSAASEVYQITECDHSWGELEVREGRFRIRDRWYSDETVHDDMRGVTCMRCGKKLR